MSDRQTIRANLDSIRERIAQACRQAGRDPQDVSLLLATKTVPPERIAIALESGCSLIGENKVQEFRAKTEPLRGFECRRHFIGHLQTNKINEVLNHVDCIQSIDSLHLAEKIDRRLAVLGRELDVFVQVNTSNEDSKFGISPDKAAALVTQIAALENLRVRGLMTIGKLFAAGPQARPCFALLRTIRDDLRSRNIAGVDLQHLSMGMTPDFEAAIMEGATIVRIGAAIFGARPTPPGIFWNEQDRQATT